MSSRYRAAALAGLLAGAPAGAAPVSPATGPVQTAPAVAVRLYLADGTRRDALLVGGDASALEVTLQGRPREIPVSSIRVVSFVGRDDFWRDRATQAPQGQTLVLRSGGGVAGKLDHLSPEAVAFRPAGARKPETFAVADVKRIYIDARAMRAAGAARGGDEAAFRPSERVRRLVGRVASDAARLRGRLEATAHHDEAFERQAIDALARFEATVADLGRALSVPEPSADQAFTAATALSARAQDVERAMELLHAYDSIRAAWSDLHDGVLPDIAEGIRAALRESPAAPATQPVAPSPSPLVHSLAPSR